jgi:alpha/beta superfamily hydrolase
MHPVSFTTEDGVRLEGELRPPDGEPVGAAVICHPHPRRGGSKDHPLLWAIRNDLASARGFTVLGFNFRGVMGSAGTYGGGRDEVRDARAAIGFARQQIGDNGATVLVGWSFGASVALREALDDRRVDALALVGMPLDSKDLALPPMPDDIDLRRFKRPTLVIAGEHDEYCPPDAARAFGESFPDADVAIVPGTDHYFWRRERDAAARIGEFAVSAVRGR